MQQVKESVAANLKKYRKESNYTQRSLADQTNEPAQTKENKNGLHIWEDFPIR